MTPSISRSRASTLQSSLPEVAELQKQIQELTQDQRILEHSGLSERYNRKLEVALRIRRSLLESHGVPNLKDSFRNLNGFQALIEVVDHLTKAWVCAAEISDEPYALSLRLFQAVFDTLATALQQHKGNQKYFRLRVEEGGWIALKRSLRACVLHDAVDVAPKYLHLTELVLGCLLGCALDDESTTVLFKRLRQRLDGHDPRNPANRDVLKESELTSLTAVKNPDAILLMFELWKDIEETEGFVKAPKFDTLPIRSVPLVIHYLADLSTNNLVALHGTGLLSSVLHSLLSLTSGETHPTNVLRALAGSLLQLGISHMDDAHFLYRHASSSPIIADLLLTSLISSRSPSYIHFDLSLNGFASVELPGIGKAFPPTGSCAGYTLSVWFQIVHFDANAHTTVFGAFDASQKCFVLVYLEKETQNLILQTSVSSSRPSVRFKAMSFAEHRWYHLVIAHRRPKTTSSSRASLFVDGEFIEQVKSQYPATSVMMPGESKNESLSPADRRNGVIQAFLGTPQDLATQLGTGLVSTQWRLASACLFADVISDDLIAVYYELGPRYTGNYQDCLGSFQTYRASAALNLRNESLHPGKDERSDIVTAIRSKAGVLLPESNVLLNISANIILDDDDQNNIDESHLLTLISKTAGKNLRSITRGGKNALAINGALPSINEALLHPSGFAVLTGDPAIVVPQSLDDAAWRVSGCAAIGLALFEAAQQPADVLRGLQILFESVQANWRNSEAMERDNGFGVLSYLLSTKVGQQTQDASNECNKLQDTNGPVQLDPPLAMQILTAILKFVGYREDRPEESVINNPLAYRVLLVDAEWWRNTEGRVQQLYYEQFIVFGFRSKYRMFNTKRLSRMRITKKWLDALKGESFTRSTFGYFLESFGSIVTRTLSAESMRSLALYITYATHKPRQKPSTPLRGKSIKLNTNLPTRRRTLGSPSSRSVLQENGNPSELRQTQIAFKILAMYTDLLCLKDNSTNIHKFARTVTNKWLLHLLADDEPIVVISASKILARLLVVSGQNYVQKFIEKTGGIVIMQHRLKRWWYIPKIWPICFAILFGLDVAAIDFSRSFDLFSLLEIFTSRSTEAVAYPAMLPVITAMLEEGLKSVTRYQSDPDSPLIKRSSEKTAASADTNTSSAGPKQRSMILDIDSPASKTSTPSTAQLEESVSTLRTITRFLADVHTKSPSFREFTSTSLYVQELLFVLFPIVVSANSLSPEMELHSRDSALTFKGGDVIMRPLSANSLSSAPIVRTTTVETSKDLEFSRTPAPRRMSSYVLLTSNELKPITSAPKPQSTKPSDGYKTAFNLSSSIVEEILEMTIAVFSDQIFSRKDFPGLGLFMKVPPGFREHQAYFETFILRNTISQLGNALKLDQKLLWEPRVLTNIARFSGHLGEAIFEGWFIDGAQDTVEFLASVLEYLQLPDIASMKTIRLCSQVIFNIQSVLGRVVLLKLSELNDNVPIPETTAFMNRLVYWQTVLLSIEETQQGFLKLLCYLVYTKLSSANSDVQMAAANLWRMLLVQKPDEMTSILQQACTTEASALIRSFKKIMELDNETFLSWMEDHRDDLERLLFFPLSKSWERFVMEENSRTEETARARISKRREKLKSWISEASTKAEILRRHETTTDHWRANIHAAEHLKWQRALQDRQDSQLFNNTTWTKMSRELRRPRGVFDDGIAPKWRLDQTEGRNRMRMRLLPDRDAQLQDYQPKRRASQGPNRHRRSLDARTIAHPDDAPPLPNPPGTDTSKSESQSTLSQTNLAMIDTQETDVDREVEDGFELVEGPAEDPEEYEDKNRKVMRSLQRGDQVEFVHNISRIVALEATEGLLILGKGHLYLLDHLFQRSDGEIVNVWQAPTEERDPYLQMISGRRMGDITMPKGKTQFETHNWRWEDVLSISKRRFLFRDVAIEVFFVDGRSFLLTASTPLQRDELYQKLLGKASNVAERTSTASGEDAWRIDAVRNPGDEIQTIGSKFTSVFASTNPNPTTRKWVKGEMSNFQYLMYVNTMAGRTFNDLTQYPVFPWVLADYTSEELDLSNPRTFRDLSKPMGCQNPDRQAGFRDRYQSFAEMGDANSPPFHYGTHYSSAMIVTSYLIRLQPYVDSYLLLQGGSFDHPDRLFYSMEKAWSSASRDNMTDVRELIPEFYYLPEFFTNRNGYDFGTRQGDGGTIDNVILPPWAKDDPKIFIAKHREALESEYVSQHLHQWIDLVFGHKQRGEAAVEATNVFHHLSYHGAKNLDSISDPVERLATIGIIHNFGQTPHQVFQRSHSSREDSRYKMKRLDTSAEGLTRLPFPLIESHDRIASLQYSQKHDQLLHSAPFRVLIGPTYDKYMEWGFIDGSIRFFATDSKKLVGLFEHVHQGQLSHVLFADTKTLVTAGSDCTVSIWAVTGTVQSVDLQPRKCLFGHRTTVTTLAVSRSFSILLSASSDGEVLLWDLNRLELVRRLAEGGPVECARMNDITGVIMLCRRSVVSLWTLNGDLILEQNIHVEGDDLISTCAFYEGSGNEYLERNLIFTGHKKGVVNIWSIAILEGKFVLEHVKRMHHLDHAGYNIGATITAILPMAQKVYTGDDDGRVYEWDCIQRQ